MAKKDKDPDPDEVPPLRTEVVNQDAIKVKLQLPDPAIQSEIIKATAVVAAETSRSEAEIAAETRLLDAQVAAETRREDAKVAAEKRKEDAEIAKRKERRETWKTVYLPVVLAILVALPSIIVAVRQVEADKTMRDVQETAEETHELVNSGSLLQLKLNAELSHWKADQTKLPADIRAAEAADKAVREHIEKQQNADAVKRRGSDSL